MKERVRATAEQIHQMVSFMEKHGDLNRAGGIAPVHLWAELVSLLNKSSAYSKSELKWRKTWTDLKNYTKRKMARLKSAPKGWEVRRFQLNNIEQRVVTILNKTKPPAKMAEVVISVKQEPYIEEGNEMPSHEIASEDNDLSLGSWNEESSQLPSPQDQLSMSSESESPPPTQQNGVTTSPQKRRRNTTDPLNPPPRRRRFTTQQDYARQAYLNSDRHWRYLEKERLRLREIELQQQARWQDLCAQMITVVDKLGTKIIDKL